MHDRLPLLSSIVRDAMWLPVTSVDVERSFSQYKHLLNERRETLTEGNSTRLMMLNCNGDVEGEFSFFPFLIIFSTSCYFFCNSFHKFNFELENFLKVNDETKSGKSGNGKW